MEHSIKTSIKRGNGFLGELVSVRWKSVSLASKALFLTSAVLLVGCSSRDANLEWVLKQKLIEFRQNNVEKLDLRTIFGDKWEKACFQGPYEDQAHFEKVVGRNVRGFQYVVDTDHVFWVFFRDGTSRWARVPRMEVMDRHANIGTRCTGFDSPYLYAAVYAGTREYYFLDKGR